MVVNFTIATTKKSSSLLPYHCFLPSLSLISTNH